MKISVLTPDMLWTGLGWLDSSLQAANPTVEARFTYAAVFRTRTIFC